MVSSKDQIVLFDIDYTLFDTDTFKATNLKEFRLYEEVIPVLKQLSMRRVFLGIFSEGDEDLQQRKIAQTMIEEYFPKEHIHICLKKFDQIDTIFSQYQEKNVYVVDDKVTILAEIAKRHSGVRTIWVQRGPYALKQHPLPDFTPDATVKTLWEVPSLIKY